MKAILSVLFALLSLPVFAWEWEASVGQTQFYRHPKEGGNWAQPGPTSQGFRDEVHMTAISYTLGAVGDIAPTWKWRGGYANLGRTSSNATATRGDARFDFNTGRCIDLCDTLTTFMGNAEVYGLYLSAQKHFHLFGGSVFVEAGPWYYVNKFQLWTYAPFVGAADPGNGGAYEMPVENVYRLGKMFGFGYQYKKTSIAVTFYEVAHNAGLTPSINDGKPYAVNGSLRMEF